MVSLTRTFHPIGFGAFYTECHKTIDKEINIVYAVSYTHLTLPTTSRV